MKPMNFPERKNQRRKNALERMKYQKNIGISGSKQKRLDPEYSGDGNIDKQIINTEAKVSKGDLLHVKSKIKRGD